MFKINTDEIPESGINRRYGEGVSIRFLILEEFGAPNFEMRYFELEPGAATSVDQHPSEHEVMILRGAGTLVLNGREIELRPHDAVLIEPGETHQFVQKGEQPLGFLCVVPNGVSSSKKDIDISYGLTRTTEGA